VSNHGLKSDVPADVTIRLSVVIPTYRRPHLLRRCLAAVAAQTLDPGLYEIVVVDDGASVETWKTVRTAAGTAPMPAIRYLAASSRRGPAAARNLGWRAARGTIIAFTDDDCIPSPDWLAEGSAMFQDPAVSGSWGQIVVPLPDQPTDHDLTTKGLERSPCATANCFYEKTVLVSVGGFDERFTAAWREDSDLQFTLLKRGSRLLPCERAVVVHPARPAPWGISLRQQRNNLFNALLYKKHPDLYRTLQPHPPWRYYASVAALFVAIGATAVMSSPLWVLGGAVTWAGLTTEFCRRRLKNTSRNPRHVLEMVVTSALIPPLAIFWRLLGALRYRVPFL
jgi:glycosyltransferase involved in cell wall biosynthesis